MPAPLAILLVLSILTGLALVWSWIEHRRPRAEVASGMPPTDVPADRSPEEAMRAALLASGRWKPKEFAAMRDDLLFVHADSPEAELVGRLVAAEGGDRRSFSWSTPDRPVEEDEAESGAAVDAAGDLGADGESSPPSPRERFRAELEARGLTDRVEPLGTFYAPGPFDAYRVRSGLRPRV